jgi:uncharacterized membrane protein YccC
MNLTSRIRKWILGCFVSLIAASIGGWLLGKDPEQLVPVLVLVVGALGIGEASNVGKRATTKVELGVPQ